MSQGPTPLLAGELTALAARLLERGLDAEATELFRMARRLDPGNLEVHLGLARARELRRRRGTAATDPEGRLREELRRSAIDAAHFLGLAHLFAERGEWPRALECLEVAKKKGEAHPGPYKLHGRILFRTQNYRGAAAQFRKALRLNPFDREIAEDLGRAEYESSRFEPALAATIDALLLVREDDVERSVRLRRRIRTLKQCLIWGSDRLLDLFHRRQEQLQVSFDRLEWHRERLLAAGGIAAGSFLSPPPPASPPLGRLSVAARLRQLPQLSGLADDEVFQLASAASEEAVAAGEVIFAAGSRATDVFLVADGEVTVRRPTSYGTYLLAVLGPGSLFGEINFLVRDERTGEAVATRPSRLLRLEGGALEGLVETSPELGVALYWSFWRVLADKLRRANEELKTFFADEELPAELVHARGVRPRGRDADPTHPVVVEEEDKIRLFQEQGLSRKELMTLATFSEERRYPAEATVFHEGDEGKEMFLVLEGKVLISKFIPGGGEEALAILGRGDVFGEVSFLDGRPRSADARAHGGPLTVLALGRETVREVLTLDPPATLEFLKLLCRLLAKRLREIDDKLVTWRIMSGQGSEDARPLRA